MKGGLVFLVLIMLIVYPVSAIENPYQFTGKPLDSESSLYYYGARYYNPDIGRFTTPDALKGDLRNPLSLNRYSYVQNNPLRFIDSTGNAGQSADATYVAVSVAPNPPNPQPPTMSQGRSYVAPNGPTMGQAYPRQDDFAHRVNLGDTNPFTGESIQPSLGVIGGAIALGAEVALDAINLGTSVIDYVFGDGSGSDVAVSVAMASLPFVNVKRIAKLSRAGKATSTQQKAAIRQLTSNQNRKQLIKVLDDLGFNTRNSGNDLIIIDKTTGKVVGKISRSDKGGSQHGLKNIGHQLNNAIDERAVFNPDKDLTNF